MTQHTTVQRRKGFSLVEVLLYLALTVLIMGTITAVFTQVVETRQRSRTIAEVDQQGAQIMLEITQAIRDAERVNSPTIGTSSSSLSLDLPLSYLSPTVYTLNGSTLQVTEGDAAPVALSSNRIAVSNVTFSNLSRSGTQGTVRIQFTLDYVAGDSSFDQDYSQTYYGSATLREN
ncbi:MAG: hypothetical protein TR69_WS6001000627 [candidate division WS6 bacterium OLB20]|uniref:Uncharacterized protein n=1 Tax=candidate division WS6 bacterium OLB20 TaxID=1617426 RepID=A0A136LY77_9BACT|nr:MAG: hypothetical protein TR69_WS6001000627 [candidate division WS6 bacterium OLB20]